jgi:hypothetical protein
MNNSPQGRLIDVVGNVVGLLVALAVFGSMGYWLYALFIEPQ